MKITNENQITFENPAPDGRNHWQDIVFNGEIIGAICETETSILNPIATRYQMLVDENEAGNVENWYESEESNKIFAYFKSLDKFIQYYNSKL